VDLGMLGCNIVHAGGVDSMEYMAYEVCWSHWRLVRGMLDTSCGAPLHLSHACG
jgi:hypothetical protein